MALCDSYNVALPLSSTSKRKRTSTMLTGDTCFTTWPNQDDAGSKKARVLSRRVDRTSSTHETFEKDLRTQLPLFNYEHLQQLLFATSMAAATVAYHHQGGGHCNSYYQVLPDMRVVKYFFDHQETMRLAYAVPIWRSTIVGEYVYFPSEGKWIFVNACTEEPSEMIDDAMTNRSYGPIREIHATPGMSHSMPPPPQQKRVVPKVRYCAHRSHTPSSNFAEVVHREPVREHWHILISKLLALKYAETDSKPDRRGRLNSTNRSFSYHQRF